MQTIRCALCFVAMGAMGAAGALAQTPVPNIQPVLQPGEGFAMVTVDGGLKAFGDAQKEAPMGSLAKLVWLRLEGDDWAARMVSFKCKGEWNGVHCWNRKGHGKVNLDKATEESCNLAFLAWSMESAERWKKDYGEGVSRLRLERAFGPFLGTRLKAGDTLPTLGPEWIGDGDLLRTTPQAMAKWLADSDQEPLRIHCKRLLGGTFDGWITKGADWWFKTGTAPVTGDPGATSAWVAGSKEGSHGETGDTIVVLHLPRGRGKAEGLARMKEILQLPKK